MLSHFPIRESRPYVTTGMRAHRANFRKNDIWVLWTRSVMGGAPQKTTAADPSELIALAIRQILRGGGVYGQPPLTF